MLRALPLLLLSISVLLSPATAHAVGTPAGSTITNTADATWVAGGAPDNGSSNPESFDVDEFIAVTNTLQTVGNVIVVPGAIGELLTFRVENVGNGIEDFTLAVQNAIVTNNFDPVLNNIYIDTDPDGPGILLPDGVFNIADDLPYNAATPPTLDANTAGSEFVTVFVFNDIPGTALNGELGQSELTAESVTGAGLVPGDSIVGGGDGGNDVVIGATGPSAASVGTYEIAATTVNTLKSGVVLGPQAVPGATIEYTLDVTVAGPGTATGVSIVDPIPAGTTYVPGSIVINGVPQGDGVLDGDDGDFNLSTPGAVTGMLPDMTQFTPLQRITFRVTIN